MKCSLDHGAMKWNGVNGMTKIFHNARLENGKLVDLHVSDNHIDYITELDKFSSISNDGIDLKIFQHCLPNQHEVLKKFYANTKINF